MILGALVDAGVSFNSLRQELSRVPVSGYSLERREVMKGAFRATKVEVHVHDAKRRAQETGLPPDHHDHPERNLSAILEVIGSSRLPTRVQEDARRIFE